MTEGESSTLSNQPFGGRAAAGPGDLIAAQQASRESYGGRVKRSEPRGRGSRPAAGLQTALDVQPRRSRQGPSLAPPARDVSVLLNCRSKSKAGPVFVRLCIFLGAAQSADADGELAANRKVQFSSHRAMICPSIGSDSARSITRSSHT